MTETRIKIDRNTYPLIACALTLHAVAFAQYRMPPPTEYGPFNGVFIPSGLGLVKKLPADRIPAGPDSPWSMYCWIKPASAIPERTLVGGIGDPQSAAVRYLALDGGKVSFWSGNSNLISAPAALDGKGWHFIAATWDGNAVTLYADNSAGVTSTSNPATVEPILHIAPHRQSWPNAVHFSGKIASFAFVPHALAAADLQALGAHPPQFDLIEYEAGSKNWPVQTRAQAGYRAPQDPATLPKSNAPPARPVAHSPYTGPVLVQNGIGNWTVAGGWRLAAAPQVSAQPAQISQPGFQTPAWFDATVPGTVLTTLIDRGVYPDPDFGLNNLAIPETLNKQDYWYRTEFNAPASFSGHTLTLTFHGINYAASVWVNGKALGNIKGAFTRGTFDLTPVITPGKPVALAVKISPPPHPGIPQEQSVKGGPGENGGLECLDGPTFIAAEGWDWIPGIRDRNSGIWQQVTISATNAVSVGDAQVVTRLPLPDTNSAQVSIYVPLRNSSASAVSGTLRAAFEGAELTKSVTVPPGETSVALTPSDFHQLSIANPRLWWPNGYGDPALYNLNLSFSDPDGRSDAKALRFGIREITYELSLVDANGQLQRVAFSPAAARGGRVVDVSHEGIIETAQGWTASLIAGAERSPALEPLTDLRLSPYLVIRVNGVRIACKGGNWGMDDSRKRVSREKLEPYFQLHRDANLNIIRNWCGQNTEETFYELADEYGLLVWNDFWQSTQNYNVEPSDTELFLNNARDTIARFRNHPSIVVWCGRNEGVPSPAVNIGLDKLVRELDGTRYYAPSSNVVNLQNSGPYKYQAAADYFTKFAHGFAVELGVPSVPTIDAIRAMIPDADRWPPGDTWAYHDWHQSGNGDVAPFNQAIENELGRPANLEDFERKAQMLDYVTHRAIFEGFNAHLWTENSGRLLWMTQPAWPSTMWQILSSDYDTQSAFYAVKNASERIHIQMNLPDVHSAVVNNTTSALNGVTVETQVLSPDGKVIGTHKESVNAPANSETDSYSVPVGDSQGAKLVFIKLRLTDSRGALLSENFYWYARDNSDYRELASLPIATIMGSATQTRVGNMVRFDLDLTNGASVSLMTKLTLRKAAGEARLLPAYYQDNYLNLLPGEKRRLKIECPVNVVSGPAEITLSGWNVAPATIRVSETVAR